MPCCSLLQPCTHPGPSRDRIFPPLQCQPAQCPHLLLLRYGLVAAVADPDFELEAHEGDGGALGAALPAHGFPTLPAVMLQGQRAERHLRPHTHTSHCSAPLALPSHSSKTQRSSALPQTPHLSNSMSTCRTSPPL